MTALELAADTPTTTEKALEDYKAHLKEKGNREGTIATTMYRLEGFLRPAAKRQLRRIDGDVAAELYEAYRESRAVDTHRGALAEVRTFYRWAIAGNLVRWNPFEEVQGIGKRRHGKEQLRIDETRKWEAKALELLATGHKVKAPGAAAALMTIWMGLRCSEIVQRVGRDIDDEGRLLWIPCAKTPAGKRTVKVPPELQGVLVARAGEVGMAGRIFPFYRKWPWTWVGNICELAGVPRVSAHGLRGTHMTMRVLGGERPEDFYAEVGHASPGVSKRSYIAPGALEQADQERALRVLQGGRR